MESSTNVLLLRGGRVIDSRNAINETSDVLVIDGRIADVRSSAIDPPDDATIIDCEACIVTPGLLDIHVHFRQPSDGRHEETIASGCASAARGGFTTVGTMPNTTPTTDSVSIVKDTIAAATDCRVVPVAAATIGRHGEHVTPIADLTAAGAVAFSDDGCVIDKRCMVAVLEQAAAVNSCVMQHCQDPAMTPGSSMHEGALSRELGHIGWPRRAEEAIVERDLAMNADIGCRWHAQHISSGGSVELIRAARAAGQPATGEASPHHLLLRDEDIRELGTAAKMNPPLRESSDINALKEGIADGTITLLATDHAPHPLATKEIPFADASFGVVGVECALPLYARALIDDGVIDWPRLIALMTSESAALIARDDLGHLTVGASADVTIIDPDASWTIDSAAFASAGRNCPFDGWSVRGRAIGTLLAGRFTHLCVGDRLPS